MQENRGSVVEQLLLLHLVVWRTDNANMSVRTVRPAMLVAVLP
jgi:hypothetical protein